MDYHLQAIRVYLHIRKLLQALNGDIETQLPLTKPSDSVKIGDVLDLSKYKIGIFLTELNLIFNAKVISEA